MIAWKDSVIMSRWKRSGGQNRGRDELAMIKRGTMVDEGRAGVNTQQPGKNESQSIKLKRERRGEWVPRG